MRAYVKPRIYHIIYEIHTKKAPFYNNFNYCCFRYTNYFVSLFLKVEICHELYQYTWG